MDDPTDEGGEAPCWAHFVDDLDPASPPVADVLSSNTIVYCDGWAGVVAFYRDDIGLRPTMERDWFVEFDLTPGARLSVADARRASVAAGNGSGLTLSWRVDDLDAVRSRLTARGVDVSPVRSRWGARCASLFDPAGNRIEFWADE